MCVSLLYVINYFVRLGKHKHYEIDIVFQGDRYYISNSFCVKRAKKMIEKTKNTKDFNTFK